MFLIPKHNPKGLTHVQLTLLFQGGEWLIEAISGWLRLSSVQVEVF